MNCRSRPSTRRRAHQLRLHSFSVRASAPRSGRLSRPAGRGRRRSGSASNVASAGASRRGRDRLHRAHPRSRAAMSSKLNMCGPTTAGNADAARLEHVVPPTGCRPAADEGDTRLRGVERHQLAERVDTNALALRVGLALARAPAHAHSDAVACSATRSSGREARCPQQQRRGHRASNAGARRVPRPPRPGACSRRSTPPPRPTARASARPAPPVPQHFDVVLEVARHAAAGRVEAAHVRARSARRLRRDAASPPRARSAPRRDPR